jgi:hypothetical protein
LVLDADPASTRVALYAVAEIADGGQVKDVIVRTRADDARSFHGTATDFGHAPRVVLVPDAPWEGGSLSGPTTLYGQDGRILLYYAAKGGVGLARSPDGYTFVKEPEPVFVRDPSSPWETEAPSSPSVARWPDGRLHMLYTSGASIGEAVSDDDVHWARLDADPATPGIDPVLGPSAPSSALAAGQRPRFDTVSVTDPCLAPRVTETGQLVVRVLYTGYAAPPGDPTRRGVVGFAARYGDHGPLVRQPVPVYSTTEGAAAPALFEWAGGSMLYVQQNRAVDARTVVPAIAAGVAPVENHLGEPGPYADGP